MKIVTMADSCIARLYGGQVPQTPLASLRSVHLVVGTCSSMTLSSEARTGVWGPSPHGKSKRSWGKNRREKWGVIWRRRKRYPLLYCFVFSFSACPLAIHPLRTEVERWFLHYDGIPYRGWSLYSKARECLTFSIPMILMKMDND
jgi:hypothetical protein